MKDLGKIIEESNGRFLSVTFIKKDGTERKLVGRLGVKKHLKGGKSSVDHEQYISIYDTQAEGYRCVNRDTIKEVNLGGKTYKKQI